MELKGNITICDEMGTQSREQSTTTVQRKNGLSSSSSSSTSSKIQTFPDAVSHFKKNDRVKTYDMQLNVS
ncbi:unnamed protein product [Onchocerca ochengi]|uniref:Ovule protein n=1 Tax=Onchocerca ochengi TaxID=42157 RepID=A0A182EIL6_ONCOC|nr:unnamed protein product [Onchocerca ochengi]